MENNKNFQSLPPRELALEVLTALHQKQGFNLKFYRVADSTVITDYYVIATGRSTTHIKALADEAAYHIEQGGVSPLRIEGRDGGEWILIDFGSVIAHIFSRDARDYYNLERLLPEETAEDVSDFLHSLDEAKRADTAE